MKGEFATGRLRFVEHMGFLDVWSFVGEGVGAALYILGVMTDSVIVMSLGIALVGSAVVALIAHLGVRAHLAWRAVAKFRTAWVSRGTVFMGLFLAFSLGSLIARFFQMSSLQSALMMAAVVFAVLVIIYAGMMLRSMRAITIWNTLYLPTTFSIHSLATALVIFVAFVESAGVGRGYESLSMQGAILLLLLSGLVSIIYLFNIKRSVAVHASLDRLLKGILRSKVLWGAGFVGIVLPLCALLALWTLGDSLGYGATTLICVLAAGCRLYGDYAYRFSIVKSGAYEPVIPPEYRAYSAA